MTEDRKFSVLFVCTGNTCRSPLAEGIARKIAGEYGVNDMIFGSAGSGAVDGMPAAEHAIAAARHWDIDLSGHRSRVLRKEHVENADLILAMSAEHVEAVLRLDHSAQPRTFMLKAFPRPFSSMQERVEDPIGGDLEQYNQTFLELDETIRKIFPLIIDQLRKS
jgi:protein-tyrosine-phosphatase